MHSVIVVQAASLTGPDSRWKPRLLSDLRGRICRMDFCIWLLLCVDRRGFLVPVVMNSTYLHLPEVFLAGPGSSGNSLDQPFTSHATGLDILETHPEDGHRIIHEDTCNMRSIAKLRPRNFTWQPTCCSIISGAIDRQKSSYVPRTYIRLGPGPGGQRATDPQPPLP